MCTAAVPQQGKRSIKLGVAVLRQCQHNVAADFLKTCRPRPGHEGRHNLLYWDCCDYQGYGPAAHSCVGRVRKYWPDNVQAFIEGTAAEVMEGDCTAEDFLLMQLRLRRGLSLAEYGRWGGSFTSAQKQFIRQCVAHGYAEFDEETLRLTPAGMVVQNSILTELM